MGMYICSRCGNFRDSHDGCVEDPNTRNGLICEDCEVEEEELPWEYPERRKEGVMKAKTLKALKGSIEKWRAIENKDGGDEGGANCPLCGLFIENVDCEGCPASSAVCACGHYGEWLDHFHTEHPKNSAYPIVPICDECILIARKEHKFLESLLP